MALRSMRTSWRSSVAVIRLTDGEIPTPAYEQNLREAGKSLRGLCKDDWIMRRKRRAGHAGIHSQDSPFMTDVANRQHGMLRHLAAPLAGRVHVVHPNENN